MKLPTPPPVYKNSKVTFRGPTRTMAHDYEFVEYPPNSTFRVWYGDVSDYYDTHWHTAVEVLMTVEGVCDVYSSNKEYSVKAGEILITPAGEPHTLLTRPGAKRYIMLFELDQFLSLHDFVALKTMTMFPIYMPTSSPIYEDACGILQSIITEYSSGNRLSEMVNYSHILRLYALMGRNYLSTVYAGSNTPPVKQQVYLEAFNHVMDYIDHHYMENITLDIIAAEAGFSKFYFTRLFKQYANTTFWHFLCLKRIQMAERLLASTKATVADIALQVGFDSIPSFNRIYRQLRNCTPTQYRARYSSAANQRHGKT